MILERTEGFASPDEQQRLKLGLGDKVLRIRRVRERDGHAHAYDIACFAISRLPLLRADTITDDYTIASLAQQSGVDIWGTSRSLSYVEASSEIALLLAVPVGSRLLKIERTTFTGWRADVLEWCTTLCNEARADSYFAGSSG